mmetsp:Transcript_34112/g.84404  ORF Transcript_34112/g.84404 Transcript_34112/m.84404 type:complete len:135 (+) Transcript_34112:147-551(+)
MNAVGPHSHPSIHAGRQAATCASPIPSHPIIFLLSCSALSVPLLTLLHPLASGFGKRTDRQAGSPSGGPTTAHAHHISSSSQPAVRKAIRTIHDIHHSIAAHTHTAGREREVDSTSRRMPRQQTHHVGRQMCVM